MMDEIENIDEMVDEIFGDIDAGSRPPREYKLACSRCGDVFTARTEGCACQIESRKQAIRHANGEGYWYYTEYVVWYPDGVSRVFQRLRDAQAEAEEYGKIFERRST